MDIRGSITLYCRAASAGRIGETGQAYSAKLRYLEHWLDLHPEPPLQLEDFQAALLERGLSPYTCRTVLTTVRAWARWCERRGSLPPGSAAAIVPPPLPPPQPRAVAPETVQALIAAALGQDSEALRARDLLIVYLLRDTGARAGGLARIELGDVDHPRRRIVTTEKGQRARQLYYSEPTAEVLAAWLHQRHTLHPRDDHLLVTIRGTAMTRDRIQQTMARLAERGGVSGRVNPHSFRHAFARDTLRAGADLSTVSQLMGHSTVRVTADYYARWADSELQAAHAKYSPGLQLPLLTDDDKGEGPL